MENTYAGEGVCKF